MEYTTYSIQIDSRRTRRDQSPFPRMYSVRSTLFSLSLREHGRVAICVTSGPLLSVDVVLRAVVWQTNTYKRRNRLMLLD